MRICSVRNDVVLAIKFEHAGTTLNTQAMARFTEVANERREKRRQEQEALVSGFSPEVTLTAKGCFSVLKTVLLMKFSFKELGQRRGLK